MPGTFSAPPWVSIPDMHRGTCVRHVPWCVPGSLTCGFFGSRWRGKRSRHSRCRRNPQLYVSGKKPIDSLYLNDYIWPTFVGDKLQGLFVVFVDINHIMTSLVVIVVGELTKCRQAEMDVIVHEVTFECERAFFRLVGWHRMNLIKFASSQRMYQIWRKFDVVSIIIWKLFFPNTPVYPELSRHPV